MLNFDFGFSRYLFGARTSGRVISLGHYCVTRYQIERHFGKPETYIFDWQTTEPESMLEYFRRGFRGLFEYDDLELRDGVVFHKELNTVHPHEFGKEHPTTQEAFETHYDIARARHDYLCGKFLGSLKADGPVLYVLARFIDDGAAEELISHLSRYRRHRPHIAMVGTWNETPPSHRREITAISIDPVIPKPDYAQWEGNDAEWSRALSQFRIR